MNTDEHRWKKVKKNCLLSVFICVHLWLLFLLFFHRLADRDLWSSHEARAAMDAQSLLEGADLPRLFDGRPELQKPPLYYWLVAAVARLRGGAVDALAVRLPAAMAATCCVLALVLLGRLSGRAAQGLLAGLILATAVHFTWLARIGRIDMPLACTTTLAVAGFYLGLRPRLLLPSPGGEGLGVRGVKPAAEDNPPHPSPLPPLRGERGPEGTALPFLAWLSLAAGLLLKGPIGLVLPGAA